MQPDWKQVTGVSHCMGQLLAAASSKLLELGGLTRGQSVLDLACGVGAVAKEAAALVAGSGGSVLGIDACEEMVAAATQHCAGDSTVRFAVHDALSGVGHPDSYDSIFCRFSLPFLQHPSVALEHSLNALKPGGRLCIMSIADGAHNDFIGALEVTGSPYVNHVMQWGNQDALAHQLEAVGFQGILTKRIRALVTVHDPNAYWDCVRGLFGFPDVAMPPEVARRVVRGSRIQVSVVLALGRKHDPHAEVTAEIQTAQDVIALARRKTREIGPTSLSQTFKGEKVVYLDVRAPASRLTQIKDSINVTRDDLETRLPSLVPDPATIIVVYCQQGSQSALAAGQLHAMGYSNVWSLQRGIEAWEYVGMKVTPA
ncbi:MAG: methyltransferase domain-containing protein [Deltaproteobacteria bacterium]|nr:methyltransferase domain-containing protein [Deltaproteobacteria bacterium]